MSNEEEPKFSIGSVVVLKSGGPDMTVSKAIGNDAVECTFWHANEGEFIEHRFHPDTIALQPRSFR